MSQIFISYSRKDIVVAQLICNTIRDLGYEAWFDVREIRSGTRWQDMINTALSESAAMVLILSPESLASEYVQYEWTTFLPSDKPLFPLLIRTCDSIPDRLNDLQWLDWTTTRFDPLSELAECLAGVGIERDMPSQPRLLYDPQMRNQTTAKAIPRANYTIDAALHKGASLSAPQTHHWQKALADNRTIRILLCSDHPAVCHQLAFRSNRWENQPDGEDGIRRQIIAGHGTIRAWQSELTDMERRRLEIRLIPYVIPDPFMLIDQDRTDGFAVVYLRNFRRFGEKAPFIMIDKREPANQTVFDFYCREFKAIWDAGQPLDEA